MWITINLLKIIIHFFSVNDEQTITSVMTLLIDVAKTIIKFMLNKIKDLTFSCSAVDIIGDETLNI